MFLKICEFFEIVFDKIMYDSGRNSLKMLITENVIAMHPLPVPGQVTVFYVIPGPFYACVNV